MFAIPSVSKILALSVKAAFSGQSPRIAAGRRETAGELLWPAEGELVQLSRQRRVHMRTVGSGPDVVLLHTVGSSMRSWNIGMADALRDRYRVTMVDMPGHNYSTNTRPGYAQPGRGIAEGPADQADTLAEACASMGILNPIILGYGTGATVGAHWVLDHGARGLVSASGALLPWRMNNERVLAWWATPFAGRMVLPLVVGLAKGSMVQDMARASLAPEKLPDGALEASGLLMVNTGHLLRTAGRQLARLQRDLTLLEARLQDISVPVEIIHGNCDEIIPLSPQAPAADKIPGATLTILDGVGHGTVILHTQEIAEAVDRIHMRAGH